MCVNAFGHDTDVLQPSVPCERTKRIDKAAATELRMARKRNVIRSNNLSPPFARL